MVAPGLESYTLLSTVGRKSQHNTHR